MNHLSPAPHPVLDLRGLRDRVNCGRSGSEIDRTDRDQREWVISPMTDIAEQFQWEYPW